MYADRTLYLSLPRFDFFSFFLSFFFFMITYTDPEKYSWLHGILKIDRNDASKEFLLGAMIGQGLEQFFYKGLFF